MTTLNKLTKWRKAPSLHDFQVLFTVSLAALLTACGAGSDPELVEEIPDIVDVEIIEGVFGNNLSLTSPHNYASQTIPNYINEDNTSGNQIENKVATLGRVMFYDKNLSSNNTVSCASCHQQSAAFGDLNQLSQGVNGVTGRHSMRLVNARFSDEERFFWDERASTLEEQATMPIQDHNEMGFSGQNGAPDINDLIQKLEQTDYMVELFEYAFGDSEITENRMQLALAQFVRSIQSFDSKYDAGRSRVNDRRNDFPNFSTVENLGKALFMGRAGCDRCHQGDEFSIDDNSDNNGVITDASDTNGFDIEVTRAPTLRDIFNASGDLNGQLMHDGSFETMEEVIAHYNQIEVDPNNNNLDVRLLDMRNRNEGQSLDLDQDEVSAIVAFVKTLSGSNVYTDPKWSDPFN
ncbi:MAG: cytochrome c peroxidase [Cyclobacteriaceae bacterium]